MQQNRRNLLAIMGLSALGVNTEALAEQSDTQLNAGTFHVVAGSGTACLQLQEAIATTLEKLAVDIRKGDIAVVKFDTANSLNVNDWLTHTLTLEVELLHHDDKPTS